MADIRQITAEFSAAPQISLDDPAALAAAGYTAIICNRPDGEDPGQPAAEAVAAAAVAAGLAFTWIPVSGGPGEAQIDAMRAALESAGGPVLAYCRSGTRSTHLWAMAEASAAADPAELVTAAARGGYDLRPLRQVLQSLASAAS